MTAVGQHYGLAGAELVVGVAPDSNNSARKLVSALGCLITFAGAGGSFGEALGFTAGPPVAQLESTTAQVSHNSIRDGLGRLPVVFMLCSNAGQHLGLFVFGGSGGLLTGQRAKGGPCLLLAVGTLGAVSAPGPAGTEHGARPDERGDEGDRRAVHAVTVCSHGFSSSQSHGISQKATAKMAPPAKAQAVAKHPIIPSNEFPYMLRSLCWCR
ncbi:hypothetical protein ABFO19_09325 [Xanthomonas citri pv. glycines]|uniref:hypothetical protein n=1 Tax=Xanthomonas TaxID=338 RepID=UPI0012B667AC|nr:MULTISPECIES: hypothetical protein [Xanthomonas]QTK36412.1 hypothetical protein XcgCFBP2526_09640 [Xanthomonas citri pv. glycines CFBP 2526]UIX76832.1 hypothetical protein LMJ37_04375 [Xanthomonas citri pv. glycines]